MIISIGMIMKLRMRLGISMIIFRSIGTNIIKIINMGMCIRTDIGTRMNLTMNMNMVMIMSIMTYNHELEIQKYEEEKI